MASICCSPPDSVPAACAFRSSSRGNIAKMRSRLVALARRLARGSKAPISRVLEHRQRRKHLAAFGDLADAEIADLVGRQAFDVLAAQA